jgi:hypothetical protein
MVFDFLSFGESLLAIVMFDISIVVSTSGPSKEATWTAPLKVRTRNVHYASGVLSNLFGSLVALLIVWYLSVEVMRLGVVLGIRKVIETPMTQPYRQGTLGRHLTIYAINS